MLEALSFVKPPSLRFSDTVNSEKILLPSKTWAIPKFTILDGSAFVMSSSSTVISPLVMSPFWVSSKPVIARKAVVLPEPLLPSKETISPFGISKDMPLRTRITSW